MKSSKAASYLVSPAPFALLAFTLLMATANNYGIFTDELYFYACAQHLAFGYVDQPPFIAWVTRFSMMLGNSLYVLRFFPALAGAGTVLLAAAVARALGDKRFAASPLRSRRSQSSAAPRSG